MSVLNLHEIPDAGAAGKQLSLLFQEGRLPHALILEGAPVRNEVARLLARALVCGGEGERPCGRCPACVKVQAGSHPDLTVLDGDADPRAFPIDAIRAIRSDAYVKPNEAPGKVFLLLGVQSMTEVSQNALLKVFEEPPENVTFILTTVSVTSLLPTIRSRAQVFSFEGEVAPEEEIQKDAAQLAHAVLAKNESELLFRLAGLIRDKTRLASVLEQLGLIFRDAAVLRAGGNVCLSGSEEPARALASALTRDRLMLLYEEAKKAGRAMERNANAALLVTALCSGLREAAGR
ncbi:MAG: DNA polymerase III subunit [Ruminococcaceae bacterium]|nr:DNA polymerase III subunit [Oscillospiraceae bacterium]